MDVHTPYIPLDSTITERLKAFRLFWKIWRNNWNISDDELKTIAHFYDREINYVDNEIGLFLNEINKMGISLDNTYIIITADHGDQLMEHGSIGHGFFYEEVIRVPLIICGPGIRKNVTVEDLVCLMDLGPTILDLLNVQKVDSFQGESLLPIMYEKKASKDAVILEGINSNSFAYRTNEWKYILMDNNSKDVSEELYNLRTDPKEKTNLVNEEKTKAEEFKSKIFDHIQIEMDERLRMKSKEKSVIPEQRMEEKEQIERRLRMLGYM